MSSLAQSHSNPSDVDLEARLQARIWHVFVEGGEPVGPVSAEQIARGVRAGRVPSDASARRDDDVFWSDLLDFADIVLALKAVSLATDPPPASQEQEVALDLTTAHYLVWIDGGDPVGPVSADQIARGIRAGKVPSTASVQRTDDIFSADAIDEPSIIAALKRL